jgi:hypothetical protein
LPENGVLRLNQFLPLLNDSVNVFPFAVIKCLESLGEITVMLQMKMEFLKFTLEYVKGEFCEAKKA